jgi:tRNA threonylcarbamoyladenosine biosynthesis protein TsaE
MVRIDLTQNYISRSDVETRAIGARIGLLLPKNSVVCFFGDLGAGKTTFIKGLASVAAQYPEEQISSPTYTYLNIYTGTSTVYHFDLYRLHDSDEFLSMGFDEYFTDNGVCCIEWSERITPLLPEGHIRIFLSHHEEESRLIKIIPGNLI